MNCRLSTPRHFDLTDIQQTIIPPSDLKPDFKGSYSSLVLEPNEHASERKGEKLALAAYVQGHLVGFIPEEEFFAKNGLVDTQWHKDAEQVRGQVFADYDNLNRTQWPANVSHVRYKSVSEGKWIEYPVFSALPPDEQSGWKIDAICINVREG